MALDGAMLYLIKNDLLRELTGARIDKISQPSRDEVVLSLRQPGDSKKLFLSANSSSARACLTGLQFDNPKRPPMFCMLLRKHLNGAKLLEVRQTGLDRVLFFDFEGTSEIGDLTRVTIAVEIMGRHSNIVLMDGEGRVIDAVKRIDEEMSSVRIVLPGARYELPPPQNKANVLDTDLDALVQGISGSTKLLSKALIDHLEGISPIVAREISHRVFLGDDCPASDMDDVKKNRLQEQLSSIRKILEEDAPRYQSVYDVDGKPVDFSYLDILQYGPGITIRHYETPGELFDSYYAERDRVQRVKQRSGDLFRLVSNLQARILRRIEAQKQELQNSKSRDSLRVFGDIVSANLYAIKKGDTLLKTIDFYTGDEVEIPLDPALTPSANAQKYYAAFKREVSAEKNLTGLLTKGQEELTYIESVADALQRASGEQDLLEISEELKAQGYLKGSGNNKTKQDKPRPLEYLSSDGYTIFAGKNNRQNDLLTLKAAKGSDLWFHVKNIPGSHVIVLGQGEEIPETTVLEAAQIAAYHSRAFQSSGVPVDYTQVRNVSKPSGARPGMVIYVNYRTLFVTPDEKSIEKLKKS